jgi:hypothetical protein
MEGENVRFFARRLGRRKSWIAEDGHDESRKVGVADAPPHPNAHYKSEIFWFFFIKKNYCA